MARTIEELKDDLERERLEKEIAKERLEREKAEKELRVLQERG